MWVKITHANLEFDPPSYWPARTTQLVSFQNLAMLTLKAKPLNLLSTQKKQHGELSDTVRASFILKSLQLIKSCRNPKTEVSILFQRRSPHVKNYFFSVIKQTNVTKLCKQWSLPSVLKSSWTPLWTKSLGAPRKLLAFESNIFICFSTP